MININTLKNEEIYRFHIRKYFYYKYYQNLNDYIKIKYSFFNIRKKMYCIVFDEKHFYNKQELKNYILEKTSSALRV